MKSTNLIPALLLALPLASANCALGDDEQPAQTPLPTSCTLLAMSPSDRAAHMERLKLLGRAVRNVTTTSAGFDFKVALETMPLKELRTWAQAEQGCCSFLKIECQEVEAEKLAAVRVLCPEHEKKEVMDAFGLETRN